MAESRHNHMTRDIKPRGQCPGCDDSRNATDGPVLVVEYPPKGGMVPYGDKGSGWSGTDTSRDRAEEADATGKSESRMQEAIRIVDAAGYDGITVTEYEQNTGLGHGPASSALTHAHRAGEIARLAEKRGRCKVYVTPDFVNGRETEEMLTRGYQHPRQYTAEQWMEAGKAAGLPMSEGIVTNIMKVARHLR